MRRIASAMLEKQLPYKHKVYEAIKKGILDGYYAPGDVLNERRLSEEMGISRTPVREALQMLAQDGWLQIETYKGAVVREFNMRYMQEIGVIDEEGMMGEGEYDDDDAFESLLDMLAGDEEDEDQMGVIAQMLDAYMTAQQRFLEESGLME